MIAEIHLLEPQFAPRDGQVGRGGSIADFRRALEQAHQIVHVGQGVLDLPVDDAEKIQRDEQLQQQGVDQHQITQRHLSGGDLTGGEEQDQGDANGDDRALPEIEYRHRSLAEHGAVFPTRQGCVAAPQFPAFVAEILDRFVVDQTIEGLVAGLRFQAIHEMAMLHPPIGDRQGEGDVGGDATKHDQGENRRIATQQQRRRQQEFHHHRQDAEGQIIQQGAQAARPPLQIAADRAGLTLQMEPQ